MQTALTSPARNTLYGLTHSIETNDPIIRTPRTVKVQIGKTAGRDLHVYLDRQGKWCLQIGDNTTKFEIRKDCELAFERAFRDPNGPTRKYPVKLPYFTFSRVGPDMSLVPDFDAIEQHGAMPTQIPIIFTDQMPFEGAYQWWKAQGLACSGDGQVASRLVELATTEEQRADAAEAKKAGIKNFLVQDGCYITGCPFAGKDCKPHGRLAFQLVNSPRLGGKAQIDTTSLKSISQLFSSIQEFLRFTGGGDTKRGTLAGIPVMLALKPWKTNPPAPAKPGTAYALSLEFRAENVFKLRQQLLGHVSEFSKAMIGPAAEVKELAAAPETDDGDESIGAAAMVAEFHPEQELPGTADDDEQGEATTTESARVAENSAEAQERLKERLKSQSKAAEPKPESETVKAIKADAAKPAETQMEPTPPAPVTATTTPAQAPRSFFDTPAQAPTATPAPTEPKKKGFFL